MSAIAGTAEDEKMTETTTKDSDKDLKKVAAAAAIGVEKKEDSAKDNDDMMMKTIVAAATSGDDKKQEAVDKGNTVPKAVVDNQKEDELIEKAVSIYEFIEIYEDTKTLDKQKLQKCLPSFTKPWNSSKDEYQWSSNHYNHQDKEPNDAANSASSNSHCGVFFTSYHNEEMIKDMDRSNLTKPKLEVAKKFQDCTFPDYYFKLYKPQGLRCPEMPPIVESKLASIQKKKKERFKDCDTHKEVMEGLTMDELSHPNLQDVNEYSKSYWDYKINQTTRDAYKRCFDWYGGAIDKDQYELVLGLGHARQLYVVNKKKSDEEKRTKIVNSPLIEILVDAEFENCVIKIFPINKTRVKWSIEAKSVIVTAGGGNKSVVSKLNNLVADADSAKLIPGSPDTYHDFLEQASELCYAGEVVDPQNSKLHDLPENPEALILNSAWCLFIRQKRSNIYSSDAHAIAEALQERRMGLSPPLRALVESSGSSDLLMEGDEPNSSETMDDIAFPLRASKTQAKIARKVLAKTDCATGIQGPPGTGKTQTAVNIAGVKLQNGFCTLVTSANPQSLSAFEEKLPAGIRKFCIDMAGVERPDGGMSKLCKELECMQYDFDQLAENSQSYEREAKKLQKEVDDMNKELSHLRNEQSAFAKEKGDVISKIETKTLTRQALALATNQDVFTVINTLLRYENITAFCETYVEILQAQHEEARETIRVVYRDLEEVDDALLVTVNEKEREASDDMVEEENNLDWLDGVGVTSDEWLDSVQVGYDITLKPPEHAEDWARVKRHLNLKRLHQKFRKNHDQLSMDSFYFNGMLRAELSKLLTAFKEVSFPDRQALANTLDRLVKFRKNQERIGRLTQSIQERQAELAFNKTAHQQIKSLTRKDKSSLIQLAQCAAKLKNADEANKSSKLKGKELRKHREFVKTFHNSLDFMRLLVMTEDQVNTYVPVDYRFDLVLVDEASLSNSTAVTLLPRAKQLVVIGDDKQVSPSDKGFNEDAIDVLNASLPNISSAEKLKPGNSLFDLCKVAFDVCLLSDHFRCPPDAVAWSNTNIYYDRMKIYKPATGQLAASRVLVKNGKKVKNVNEAECKAITDFVYKEVENTAKNGGIANTIGIISMAGKHQKDRIQEILEEKLDEISQKYTSKTVDRHNILVGESSAFQGNERDIMLLSCVHDAKSIKTEVDQESLRGWNVSSTRCTKKIVLFHSFEKKHIKNRKDHKRDILDHFVEAKGIGDSRVDEPPLFWPGEQEKKDGNYLKIQAREKLLQRLKRDGFTVSLNRGNVWVGALSISSGDTCALVYIENYGETLDDWSKVVGDQSNLEGAGTSCLRVDTLAVAFNFESTVNDIVSFLKDVGLQHTTDVKSPPIQTTTGNDSLRVLSDPSDSEFDSQDSSVMKSRRKRKRPVT